MSTLRRAIDTGLAERYRVEGDLGAGGMATVYLAHDLRHQRKVAIKVLRPEIAAMLGAERFHKEIEVTANLQHPHILGLIDSGVVDGHLYYVMPFVQGESLRARLSREHLLSVDETVRIATTIASALHYAHRHGVIHRDIKPENILLQDGQAMIADFGIALAATESDGRMTETGLSLGTPSYMSPEQASGERQVDARSDIFSLACVVYEMLSGAPPFTGANTHGVLTAVMTRDPEPITTRRHTVPVHVAAAVHAALEKIPADRFVSAHEFAEALQRPTERTAAYLHDFRPARAQRMPRALVAGVAAVSLLGGLALGRYLRSGPTEAPNGTRRWSLMLPEREPLALTGPGPLGVWQSALALSPDGNGLAYVTPTGGSTALVVRQLDRDSAVVLPGTTGAYHPFFSPDGSWIGFFAGNELRKVARTGGIATTLTTADRPAGAVWATADRILLFEQDGFRMHWIRASGRGDSSIVLPTQFTTPELLPGGRWAIGQLGSGQLALLSLTDATLLAITRRGVVPLDSVNVVDLLFGTSPRYVRSGHVVFGTDDGVLMALPFDPDGLRVLGEPAPVVTGVRIEEGLGFAEYALAWDGTMIYVPGVSQLYGHLAFVDASGRIDTLPFPRGQYMQLRLSPDGTRLATQIRKPFGGWDVLVMDLESGVRQRVPVEGNYRSFPAHWTPDGRTLMVGIWDPVQFVTRGALLYSIERGTWDTVGFFRGSYMSIAPNGREFVFSDWRTGDLFTRDLQGDTVRRPIPARGFAASFSPDGRWLAWGDVDGGVAVSPLPPTGRVYRVAERGQQPLWSSDGTRLIYRDGRRFHEIAVTTSGEFRASRPRLIAEGPFVRTFAWNHSLAPDGRIAVLLSAPGESTRELGVITGFDERLRRLVPRP